MSRPQYNFADERPSSPFDQRPRADPSAPPPNFKPNVNRNKTRKWTEAKQYNYDGDEWGGFDPYDEYGNYDDRAGPPPASHMRQHSFDKGEERRAFSAGTGMSGQQPMPKPPPQQRRDFSQPAYAPAPLKSPQIPAEHGPAGFTREDDQDKNDSKPPAAIPFIRPSDIYKRMEQERERERQSMDSARPSVDSVSSRSAAAGQSGASPETRDSPFVPDFTPVASDLTPRAPPLSTAVQTAPRTTAAPLLPDDMPKSSIDGFRSVVDSAFDRQDDGSVPPTPISTSNSTRNQEDVSRSNSDSTTGISPIMSRVPSSAAEDSRVRAAAINKDRAMSDISEEIPHPPHANSVMRPTTPIRSSNAQEASSDDFTPGHTRNISSPSSQPSPARTPRLDTTNARRLSQPLAAEVAQDDDSEIPSATSDDTEPTCSTSAVSEPSAPAFPAPLTSTENKSPTSVTPTAAKSTSRSTTPLASPIDGRKSPYPGGRVRDLAGKYNEIHEESTRSSQASIKSKTSYSSLRQKSGTGSGHASPEPPVIVDSPADTLERPPHYAQQSFRPHLPGEWVSTSDFSKPSTGTERNEQPQALSVKTLDKDLPKTPATPAEPSQIDLSPTSTRSTNGKEKEGGAVDALKAAGAALGASLTAAIGTSHQSRDFASPNTVEPSVPQDNNQPRRSTGDVLMRPLEFQRTASSVASSGAPTPPAKDSIGVETGEPSNAYFKDQPRRLSEDSWEGSVRDDDDIDNRESDRLTREIVRSLTPQPQGDATDESAALRDSSDVADMRSVHQEADNSQPVQSSPLRAAQSISDLPDVAELHGSAPQALSSPGYLSKRFSWESRPTATVDPSGLGPELDLPQTQLHVTNQEPPSAASPAIETSNEAARERQLSASSGVPSPDGRSPISAGPSADGQRVTSQDVPRESITERLSTDTPISGETDGASKTAKIPSFREIANIKSTPERIEKYGVTRKQFADMNTGLQGWLTTTIAANPELEYLTKPDANIVPGGAPVGSVRHRQAPSIIKMAKSLGSKADAPTSPSAAETHGTPQPTRHTSNTYSNHSPQSSVNAEKMQAMGKDFLSSAGKLGGKGMAGAKGWLAKGKQRLRESSGGGDKAPSTEISRSVTPSSLGAPAIDDARSSSPGLSDAPVSHRARSRHTKQNSSSWSTHRLSMTLGFRSDKSEKSRSRSRPQSLIIPTGSSTPIYEMEKPILDDNIPEESSRMDELPNEDAVAASTAWASTWGQTGSTTPPVITPFNDPGFRLGILPSPGVETFTSSHRGSQDTGTPAESPTRASHLRRDTVDSRLSASFAQSFQDQAESVPKLTREATVTSKTLPESQSPDMHDKRDTPMICSPEFRLKDDIASRELEADNKDWAGIKARFPAPKPSSISDSKRSSGMALSSGLQSAMSDLSSISPGTLERPAQVEMARVGSPKLINNRSSLPSQSRQSSWAKSPQATPHKEVEQLKFWSRNTDSPTLPEHLTPRSLVSSPHVFGNDAATPGAELDPLDEATMETPTESRAPERDFPETRSPLEIDPARSSYAGAERISEMKHYGIVDPEVDEGTALATGTTRGYVADANPVATSRRATDAEAQRWSQHEGQLDTGAQASVANQSPQLPGNLVHNMAGNSDNYHRNLLDERPVEMSPLEAPAFDREEAFRQATADQQQGSTEPQLPTLGPSPASDPPRAYQRQEAAPEKPSAAPSRRSSSRFFGMFDRVPSTGQSTNDMRSTMDLDKPGSPAKGKLVKKDRRASMQPTPKPTPLPEQSDKKKRFSSFGAFFGRSKSNAVAPSTSTMSPKRNRLSKQGPMIMSASRQASPEKSALSYGYPAVPAAEITTLVDDNSYPRSVTPLSRRGSGVTQGSLGRSNTMNTLGSQTGWSSAQDELQYRAQPTGSSAQSSPRRLHSERQGQRTGLGHVSAQFQSVTTSYRSGTFQGGAPRGAAGAHRNHPGNAQFGRAEQRVGSYGHPPIDENPPAGYGPSPSKGGDAYHAPADNRRTPSWDSGYSVPQQRQNFHTPSLPYQQPPRLRDNNGYYISADRNHKPYWPAEGQEQIFHYERLDGPRDNLGAHPQNSNAYSSPYVSDRSPPNLMPAGYDDRRNSYGAPQHSDHRSEISRETSVPYSLLPAGDRDVSPVSKSREPRHDSSIEKRHSRRLSAQETSGYGFRRHSPSKRQAEEHNDFVRRSYERQQQGYRSMPSNASTDSELYARPEPELRHPSREDW